MLRQLCLSMLATTFTSVAVAEQTLYESEQGALSAGLKVQSAVLSEVNNLSGSPDKANLTDSFLETSIKPHINAALNLPSDSKLYGGFSYVYSSSWGHDPSGMTQHGVESYLEASDYTVLGRYNNYRDKNGTEELYLGWKSGKLVNNSGESTIDLSGGRQNYTLGSGFLLHYGADNGGNRGANWINPRTAFTNTVIARVTIVDAKVEGFHLETRPINTAEKRSYQGANVEYKVTDNANLAVSYINTTNSRSLHEVGSTIPLGELAVNNDTYDARADFSPLPDVTMSAEYVYQTNTETTTTPESVNKTAIHASGGFGQIEYKPQDVLWQPAISYRYAIQNEGFDSMAYGFSTWGTWFQGEINGEFILNNSNLITHVGRLVLTPNERLALNLIYLNYRFVNPEALALTASDYGNEVNLLADWELNEMVELSAGLEAFMPAEAGKQYLGGNKMWLQGMVSATFEF